eukprot:gene10967-22922_t
MYPCQLYKLDPNSFDVWINILKRVPISMLWLLRFPAAGEANILLEMRWSGTPLITLSEEKMASRVAASLLTAAGLEHFICKNLSEYEDLAVDLAMDTERLFRARRHLENSRESSALFDTERWVRNMETALETAFYRNDGGFDPDHITVVDDIPLADTSQPQILGGGGGGGGSGGGGVNTLLGGEDEEYTDDKDLN